MTIRNLTRGTVLAERVNTAQSLKSRIVGLIGQSSLVSGSALALPRCNSIHTFFMRFAIDVLFLDAKGKVAGKIENMLPFRISPIFWRAKTTIELPAGTLKNTATQLADYIVIES